MAKTTMMKTTMTTQTTVDAPVLTPASWSLGARPMIRPAQSGKDASEASRRSDFAADATVLKDVDWKRMGAGGGEVKGAWLGHPLMKPILGRVGGAKLQAMLTAETKAQEK